MGKKGAVLTGVISFAAGFFFGGKALVGMINSDKMRAERNLSNMMLLNDWMEFQYAGGRIERYFHERGYKKIMIYGNGYVGQRLFQALKQTDVDVVAVMDRMNPSDFDAEGILIGTDSEIPDVDCVVITPVFYFDEIYQALRGKTEQEIISIEELWQTGT